MRWFYCCSQLILIWFLTILAQKYSAPTFGWSPNRGLTRNCSNYFGFDINLLLMNKKDKKNTIPIAIFIRK